MNDFLRMLMCNQMDDQLYCNGISYPAFALGGYHLVGYDLTTSLDGGSQSIANPTVRVGNYPFFPFVNNCYLIIN